ncbi:TPA: ribonuclease J [Candidatus Uhrbacteria bacterium]|nr:ribonuclease J [Candidatus Uhrbacteria bacterium]HAN06166.1 ribonuclease J [Candidatus Uhrbacteria bacterium]HAP65481.1 ribonuclease J [Candidatus Uhrbacteria bacterium]HBA51391.1 ribonuclease J [Candidatus Uhrbacteria bacterium]HBC39989.1 ribonuclease J [Candidatus Uhrbacteria bacterium]
MIIMVQKQQPQARRNSRRKTFQPKQNANSQTPRPLHKQKPVLQQNRTQQPRPTQQHRPVVQTFKGQAGEEVRLIVLGGLEEVGRNCTLIEYKNDIILIDMGLEFPQEDMHGVDYIIPNMSYLKGKERNVRGVVITHGHYDHIGGIPHLVPKIGNPPVYALPIGAGIIKKRQEDYPQSNINIKEVTPETVLQLGVFKVSFIHMNHNIPDSAAVVVETPAGMIVHSGDWKFDFHPAGDNPGDLHKMARLGDQGILLLMGDSTNANKEGQQTSEKVIGEELRYIIEQAKGRVIIGTFASLLSRVKQVLEISEQIGRKVAIDGRSMKSNVEIARQKGFIHISDRTLIPIEKVNSQPDEKILIMCTGAQGEENAALSRITNDEHKNIRIKKGDTVIFSSSIVPGNEVSVSRLKDTLYRKGAKIIHSETMDVHAGGHGKKEDIKLLITLLKPQYYMPIEGNYTLLSENANVAYSLGYKEQNVIVADNGQVIQLSTDRNGQGHVVKTDERVNTEYVFVDGLGVGDVSQVVLRDRQMLAEDGMVIAVVQIDKKTGGIIGNPDIISRGFIFMKDNQKLIQETRSLIKKAISDQDPESTADSDYIKSTIRDAVGKYLFKKTQRRPMILPVVIQI